MKNTLRPSPRLYRDTLRALQGKPVRMYVERGGQTFVDNPVTKLRPYLRHLTPPPPGDLFRAQLDELLLDLADGVALPLDDHEYIVPRRELLERYSLVRVH